MKRGMTVRGAYAEAVSGPSFDESIRLEPTQVNGFLQAYRTVISEALIGSVSHELRSPLSSIIGSASILARAPEVRGSERLLPLEVALDRLHRDEAVLAVEVHGVGLRIDDHSNATVIVRHSKGEIEHEA